MVERLIQLVEPDGWPKTVEATNCPLEIGEGICNIRFVTKSIPVACKRRMEREFAGSVTVKLVPALEMEFVTGKTFTGAASEFSSDGLAEVN